MKLKKSDILFILFLATLWGASEAILGGALYRAGLPRASILLTIIALAVLTLAREYRPQIGLATLLALIAVLYKGFGMIVLHNSPIFVCHFWGILMLGVAYDAMRLVFKDKRDSLFAVSATYLGFALFALTITYVFRYSFWYQVGISKVLDHILISGTITAIASAIVVPAAAYFARALKARQSWPFAVPSKLATGIMALLVVGLWILSLGLSF